MSTLQKRVADLEVRVEAFQSINLEMVRLLVDIGLDPKEKEILVRILQDWFVEIELVGVSSGDTLGLDLQKAMIALLEQKITGKIERNQ